MRTKSVRLAANRFSENTGNLLQFVSRLESARSTTDTDVTWAYEYGIIRLYRDFEDLMLNCLIATLNTNPVAFSEHKGIGFPRKMNVEVCEYLISGEGYFDFRGRSGLIREVRKYVPEGHWLLETVKENRYHQSLDRLSALRNFAAHDSPASKRAALKAVGLAKMSSAGSWLKRQNRFVHIVDRLQELAEALHNAAPH
ncbi:hypothetical protein FLO80_09005 [Aquicoccus porphyridii]|uniref:RiboL-PSP-HEPN domain-containing protein n=1 Tax=Aquicoccus porphyridii TaxID=1852029 RepID=A0A5A9ZG60_9RHOB|nr:hypothetical protein [Aquicoccus porphyridii]KAA0916248.1 hypothetical protein FLO80_09005 [Aquicoccus porphyridii]